MKEPDLGIDYSGIDSIALMVKDIKADYGESYYANVLDYVLWILDDYKRMKLQEKDIIVKPPHTYGWRASMIETDTAEELNAGNIAYGREGKCKN